MGWGCHPDTLTIARAQRLAARSGHEPGTLGYVKAYRDAYEQAAGGQGRGLVEMLARMDAIIAKLVAPDEVK